MRSSRIFIRTDLALIWIVLVVLCNYPLLRNVAEAGRGNQGKLVVTNKDACKCPKGDDTDWANQQYYYCGSQINSVKCDVNAIYSCKDKAAGDDPILVNKCESECRINAVKPVATCDVEYSVPRRAKYSGNPEDLKTTQK